MKAIIFSGPAASGKSSTAKEIAKKLNVEFFDGGDILKLLAKDMGYNVDSDDFWDTREGMEFFKIRKSDPSFDHKVDEKFKDILDKGNCVVTSWTMPWLYEGDAIKIYIDACVEERIKRMAVRDNIGIQEAANIVTERDNINESHFKELYEIDIVRDMKPFDIVLDTSDMNKEEVIETILEKIKEII